jgi:hypothetical protein
MGMSRGSKILLFWHESYLNRSSRFLSQEISSGGGDDDDVEITGESSLGASAKTNRVPSATKRKRSRSRSLTPPPEVNPYHLASAANIVR